MSAEAFFSCTGQTGSTALVRASACPACQASATAMVMLRCLRWAGTGARPVTAQHLRLCSAPLPVRPASLNRLRHASSSTGRERREEEEEEDCSKTFKSARSFFNSTGWETAMGASAGVILLGAAAMIYQAVYKARVLKKMEAAFDGGYDPVLALVENSNQMAYVQVHPPRPEEALVESIIQGKERGRYFLVLGSKGSGKTTMIIQAMSRNKAEGCAFFEAHPDPSIVVDRFSEAINFRCVE